MPPRGRGGLTRARDVLAVDGVSDQRVPPVPPFACVWFIPGTNARLGSARLAPQNPCASAMRAETSVWLRSTSALQLELLLADSDRISSSPLFDSNSFRPGPIAPSSGQRRNCKYVMQTRATTLSLWGAFSFYYLFAAGKMQSRSKARPFNQLIGSSR